MHCEVGHRPPDRDTSFWVGYAVRSSRPASGHAAAPPRRLMNLRRRISSPKLRGQHCIGSTEHFDRAQIWHQNHCRSAQPMSQMGLGRVKTKSDLVVMPSGRQIFAFFCSPHDHRAQNSRCGDTARSFYTVRVIFVRSTRFRRSRHVRFAPIASEPSHRSESTRCATPGLMHAANNLDSITPSARASSDGGTVS
jgi:hypothetical protein